MTTLATRTQATPVDYFAPTVVTGWQAVTLHQWEDTPIWDARDAASGVPVGTLCQWTPGLWQAQRLNPAYDAASTDNPGDALTAVDWLLCVPAGMLGRSLASDPRSVAVVLPDGTPATADHVQLSPAGTVVTFRLDVIAGERVDMAAPASVAQLGMRAEVPADDYSRKPRFTATFGHLDPVALAPACRECETLPGQPCEPYAAHG